MTNATIDFLKSHRSIRKYTAAAIPAEHIRAAVEAGQAASTSSAVQSYCLIQVTDVSERQKLAELTGPQEKVASCAAFFIVCGDTRRHRLICKRASVAYEAKLEAFLLAVIDATLFAQNLVIAFESMGYGICYIGGLRNQLAEVDRLLDIPAGVYPLYGLCVGVPDEQPTNRPRIPIDSVLFEGRYPNNADMLSLIDAYDEQYASYLKQRNVSADKRRSWSSLMAQKFSTPKRDDLGSYYRSKGANLS